MPAVQGVHMGKRSVLITGASRGIGRACAFRFARAGYFVFINCRHSVTELYEIKRQLLADGYLCEAVPGDAGDPADTAQIFSRLREICDGPDVLVNNAGISYVGLLTDMTDQDWEDILHSNLSSAFYCSRAALPALYCQGPSY